MDCSLPVSSAHGISLARVLEWVAISFSRGSSRPRDRTWVSCIAGRHFTVWATREAQERGKEQANTYWVPTMYFVRLLSPWFLSWVPSGGYPRFIEEETEIQRDEEISSMSWSNFHPCCLPASFHYSTLPSARDYDLTIGLLYLFSFWLSPLICIAILLSKYKMNFKIYYMVSHVKTWMNLEDIMLSKISQTQKGQILCDSIHMKYL